MRFSPLPVAAALLAVSLSGQAGWAADDAPVGSVQQPLGSPGYLEEVWLEQDAFGWRPGPENGEGETEQEDRELGIWPDDDNTGVSGSTRPHIPEPMVFDLIRPLGARKGELEVNTLFFQPLRGNKHLDWAPEVEYAFADGYAVEFELPMENLRLESYKLALQGTLGTGFNRRFIHGWQVFGRHFRESKAPMVDVMHISGLQLSRRWSALTMQGMRHTDLRGGRGRFEGIANASLFYAANPRLTLGMESNLSLPRRVRDHAYLFVPQVHVEMGNHYSLQMGGGFERYQRGRFRPLLAMRLIREF